MKHQVEREKRERCQLPGERGGDWSGCSVGQEVSIREMIREERKWKGTTNYCLNLAYPSTHTIYLVNL